MIKIKYVHVRDNNEPAPDSICYDLMQAIEDSVVSAEDAEADEVSLHRFVDIVAEMQVGDVEKT
jgi:hypothetical protein